MRCLVCETCEAFMPTCQQCRQQTVCLQCLANLDRKWCPNCRMDPFNFLYDNREVKTEFEEVPSKNSLAYLIFSQLLDRLNLPEIDLTNHPNNGNSYIDYIDENMMIDSIVTGHDVYNRKFITFKVKDLYSREKIVFTVFQRRSDRPNYWTSSNFREGIFDFSGGVDSEQMLCLSRILTGETICLEDRVRPRDKYFESEIELDV